MSEMTMLDGSPQLRKSTPWKVIIPVVLVVLMCCVCAFSTGILMYLGVEGIGPLKSLADSPVFSVSSSVVGEWDLYYSWDCDSYNGPATVQFSGNGTYSSHEDYGTGTGTWTVKGKTIEFAYDSYPYAHYTGTLNGAGSHAEGTMNTQDGSSGCWYADKK